MNYIYTAGHYKGAAFIFGSGTDPISLLILLFLLWRRASKKPNAPSFQIGSGWNSARLYVLQVKTSIDWRSRIFDLTSRFQDGGHNVILRKKVLPSGESTRKQLLQRPPAVFRTCYDNFSSVNGTKNFIDSVITTIFALLLGYYSYYLRARY